jgi:uncharacterized membrane protein AbrB (regulator of aidB expression)
MPSLLNTNTGRLSRNRIVTSGRRSVTGIHSAMLFLRHFRNRRPQRISRGDHELVPVRITFPEGSSSKQIAKILTLLLLPFIVVMGRIIFSESDSTLLLFKLQQVINWDTDSANAISHHIQFDTKTLFTLIFGGILMGFEFAFPILAKRYRFLRNQYLCVIWVFLCIEFSSFGIEGVYGTR